MRFSIRSHRYGLPLITILVFAVSLLLGLGKLLEEGRENRNDVKEPLYWAASQTLVEYWRFVNALDRYVATPDAANPDAVMLRLNILWSRIGLYQTGEVGERLQMIEGVAETIPALADTLREIEPLLPTLNADNRSAIADMRDRLASYAHPLQQMAQQTNLFEQGRAVDLREGHGQTRRLILALLFGVILSGTPLIILLFRETRATSRLLAVAQAAKATAQDAAERLGAILDNSVTSIVTIDAQGTITSFNPAAERLFGYSAADAVSKNVTLLMSEEDAVVHQRHLDSHFSHTAHKAFGMTREVIARRADGSVFPIEIAVGEMRHGGRTHFVGFIIDISERKKAENALKSSEQRFRDITEIAGERARVRIDPGRLSQALFKFVINAKDAMPQGGTLTVSCRIVELDDAATVGFDHAPAARYVMISVADTGTGIDEDTLEKMFEPFFTTKEVGKGTGLGLTMAYGAVQQSGGVIAVESELGTGTSFNIYLPLAESPDETDDETEDQGHNEPTGSETVLLVEDESAVRRMVRFTLEDLGYRVLMAEDGAKGLDVFLGHDGRIDLLLSDLRMPGMNGWQLASELIAQRPDLKVLFMTGHDVSTHEEEIKNVTTLLKPLKPRELAHAVRSTLDASDRPSAA